MYPAFEWSELLATMRDSRVPVLKNGPALKASFFAQASGTPLDCSVMKFALQTGSIRRRAVGK